MMQVDEDLKTNVSCQPPSLEALGEFAKAHRDRAYSVALRIVRSPADAEDVVQDAAIKWLRVGSNLKTLESNVGLFYRLVLQCALDSMRKESRRNRREASIGEGGETMRVQESVCAQAERGELKGLLKQAVAGLSEDEQLAVTLCFYEGISVVDTAKCLNVPRETVQSRLQRAMLKLRAFLKSKGHVAGVAVVLGLMWRDGSQLAPEALCLKLDRLLHGRPCSQIAESASSSPINASEFTDGSSVPKLWMAVVPAVIVVGLMWVWNSTERAPKNIPVVSTSVPSAESRDQEKAVKAYSAEKSSDEATKTDRELPASKEIQKEPRASTNDASTATASKVEIGKVDDDVAAAIRAIEARNEAKLEARARQVESQFQAERGGLRFQVEPGAGFKTGQREKTVPQNGTK